MNAGALYKIYGESCQDNAMQSFYMGNHTSSPLGALSYTFLDVFLHAGSDVTGSDVKSNLLRWKLHIATTHKVMMSSCHYDGMVVMTSP